MRYVDLRRAMFLGLLSTVLLYLPWFIAALGLVAVLDFADFFHANQSVAEVVWITAAGIVLYLICRIIWSNLVINRSDVLQVLERLGFVVRSNSDPIEATRENIWVEITLDRSLMDYHPTPRKIIVKKDGKTQFVRTGSYDPRYMYRLGTASFQKKNTVDVDISALKIRLEEEYGSGVVKEISFVGRDLAIKLAVGTWLGKEMLLMLENVIGTLSQPNALPRC